MPSPIIRIDNITKTYGPLTVLDGLSMNVMPGEKLALIGPSGSGKTTILRILMTLEKINGGHIEVDGEQLYHMQKAGSLSPPMSGICKKMREKIGMVFQHFNLFPHKCVLDNITLAPMLTKGVRAGRGREAGDGASRHGGHGRQGEKHARATCPAARSSAWPSPARWRCRRRSCCSTR